MAAFGAIGRQIGEVYRKTTRVWTPSTMVIRALVETRATFAHTNGNQLTAVSSVTGVVRENSIAVERLVRVYRRSTGELIGSAMSDAVGVFSIKLNGFTGQVFVIAFDDAGSAPNLNAQIYDMVIPI